MTPTLEVLGEVLGRLHAKLPDVQVELFPESPVQYRLNHPKAAVLLSYHGGKFEEVNSLGVVSQPRQLHLLCHVVARQLNGSEGAVALCDRVRAALIGYQPVRCDRRIWAVKDQFVVQESGLWLYGVELATALMSVQEWE